MDLIEELAIGLQAADSLRAFSLCGINHGADGDCSLLALLQEGEGPGCMVLFQVSGDFAVCLVQQFDCFQALGFLVFSHGAAICPLSDAIFGFLFCWVFDAQKILMYACWPHTYIRISAGFLFIWHLGMDAILLQRSGHNIPLLFPPSGGSASGALQESALSEPDPPGDLK